ncbi:uncharacterized protein LOC112083884 [Eutrema salsugineum]|uniref:uncharacterized protein LOC112083884 n=1 Tax=Eutrema salsugineum TaxID=72664 RepID=UPI000CED69A1|nr:uncharacterized protein LOC112083884 [Eutrema salsugineum]
MSGEGERPITFGCFYGGKFEHVEGKHVYTGGGYRYIEARPYSLFTEVMNQLPVSLLGLLKPMEAVKGGGLRMVHYHQVLMQRETRLSKLIRQPSDLLVLKPQKPDVRRNQWRGRLIPPGF